MTAKQRYDGNFLPRFQKDFQMCVIGNAATFPSRFPWLTAGAVYYICGYDTAITFPWWRDTTSPWLRFLCFLPRQICGERLRGINHGAAGIGEEKAKMLVSGSRIVICLLCNIQSRFRHANSASKTVVWKLFTKNRIEKGNKLYCRENQKPPQDFQDCFDAVGVSIFSYSLLCPTNFWHKYLLILAQIFSFDKYSHWQQFWWTK